MTDESGPSTSWEDWLRRHGANPSPPEPVEEYVKRKELEEVLYRLAYRDDEWVHWPSDEARKRRIFDTEYEERLLAWKADEQNPWVSEPIGRAFRWVRTKFSQLRHRRNRS